MEIASRNRPIVGKVAAKSSIQIRRGSVLVHENE
jgi:hypothetical protein